MSQKYDLVGDITTSYTYRETTLTQRARSMSTESRATVVLPLYKATFKTCVSSPKVRRSIQGERISPRPSEKPAAAAICVRGVYSRSFPVHLQSLGYDI